MFHVPNQFRIKKGLLGSSNDYGNAGAFDVPIDKGIRAFCIASDAHGWEHVSVHIIEKDEPETPAWEEMCFIKNLFWGEEDYVMQLHPPQSDYVNNHAHTLHLWRPIGKEIPLPLQAMVGIKGLKLG